MEGIVQPALAFIAGHTGLAVAVMFIAAFGESFVFLSFLFPGTSLLVAAGALLPDGTLPALPVLAAAILGAVLGDAVSFWVGRRFGDRLPHIWPFSRRPDLLPGGIRFFERHGGKSVFLGRFLGPMRAVVPLAAGLLRMPSGRFWVANVSSALLWAPMLLYAGDAIGQIGDRLLGPADTIAIVFGGFVLFGIVGALWAFFRSGRRGS
jgi:membrane protein DedA with SNARE-associated domain